MFLLLPLAVVWYYYRKWVDNSKAVGIVSLPGMMTGQILF
ncbi:ABC transporter permease [Sulfurimonas sp. CS5]